MAASASGARSSSLAAARTAAMAAAAAQVIGRAAADLNTLIDFRYRQHFRAPRGGHGRGRDRTGASGADLVLDLPVGTQILAEDGATADRRPDRAGADRDPGAWRRRRARQQPLQIVDQSRAARVDAGRARRGALAVAEAQAAGRCRPGRPAECRQVDLSGRGLARAAQDRRLPLHHAGAQARHGGDRPRPLRDRRHPGPDRGRASRAPGSAIASSAISSAAGC